MIVTGIWQEVTLTANASTTIQNKDYNYVRVAFDATIPTVDDIGYILSPSGTENSVLKFNHTGDKMWVRCDTGTTTIDVEGETIIGTQLGAPTIDLAEGTYFNEIELTLADTSGETADIYYTINRINPSKGNGELYSAPFTVGGLYKEGVYIVKAIAIKSGFLPSDITEKTYTINKDLVISELQGIQIWLDANDDSTITESGGDVSQWDDKSGLDNHATQVTAIDQPSYSLVDKQVNFLEEFINIPTLEYKEAFVVVNNSDGSDANTSLCPLIGENATNNDFVFLRNSADFSISLDGNAINTGSASINGSEFVSGTDILIPGYAPFPNSADKIIVNFKLDNSATAENIARFFSSTEFKANISISEVILTSEHLSEYKRDSVYNGLVSKWGV